MTAIPRSNPEAGTTASFLVTPGEQDLRLDRFLAQKLSQYSRSRIQKWIKEGLACRQGRPLAPDYRVRAGDLIQVVLPPPAPRELLPEACPLDVLYEDEDLLIINKPPGLTVHPGAGQRQGTLVNVLVHHYPELARIGELERPGLVHRLDKDTSGALVVAKTEAARLALIHLFQSRQVEKKYLALIWGVLSQEQGEIKTTIGRHPVQRQKMAVNVPRGREAHTSWRQQRQWDGVLSLVELSLHTGRTHQLRVHLAFLGHPIVGDKIYGGGHRWRHLPEPWRQLEPLVTRQLLHAWRLTFSHPRQPAELVTVEAPLAADFQQVLDWLTRHGDG